jgi:hypothetical protein
MRSKSRAKRSNTELNPLIGDFINTIGQKQTQRYQSTSASPPKAYIQSSPRHVRFVPKAT